MRVIAGTARRLKLETPAGRHTRPTSDKIKETLFNIIQQDLYEARFLDLFSGSGGIAIEALSRGAAEAVLVDNDREALRCIRTNLHHTHFEEQARVMAMDVIQALRRLDQQKKAFDVIFMDPPYSMGLERRIIPYLIESSLVHDDTRIIVEASMEDDPIVLPPTCDGMWRESRNTRTIVIYLSAGIKQPWRERTNNDEYSSISGKL